MLKDDEYVNIFYLYTDCKNICDGYLCIHNVIKCSFSCINQYNIRPKVNYKHYRKTKQESIFVAVFQTKIDDWYHFTFYIL